MRLSREDVKAREKFIREAVRTRPQITGRELQDLLAQHFGHRMRIQRLYQLKNKALETLHAN